MKIARVTLSDRAANGVYADASGPEIERIAATIIAEPLEWIRVLLPDDRALLEAALRRLADDEHCPLILTTGGTGPSPRDITPRGHASGLGKRAPRLWRNYAPAELSKSKNGDSLPGHRRRARTFADC